MKCSIGISVGFVCFHKKRNVLHVLPALQVFDKQPVSMPFGFLGFALYSEKVTGLDLTPCSY